jgi:hypothetical protein
MTYKVYSSPAGTETISPIEKSRMLYKEFASFDEALSWAGHVEGTGRVAVLLEGDDGTHLTKREIAAELAQRGRAVASR